MNMATIAIFHSGLSVTHGSNIPWPVIMDCYGKGVFSRDGFSRLKDILQGISGRFIMLIDDTEEIRGIFSPFHLRRVETRYGISGRSQKTAELLVMNFESKTA